MLCLHGGVHDDYQEILGEFEEKADVEVALMCASQLG